MGNIICHYDEPQTLDFMKLKKRNNRDYPIAGEKDDKIWFELRPDGFKEVPTPYYAHPSDAN